MLFRSDITMKIFKTIFRTPSAYELAIKELEDAKRQLLEAHTRVEWSTRMMQYHTDRVQRLTHYVYKEALHEKHAG